MLTYHLLQTPETTLPYLSYLPFLGGSYFYGVALKTWKHILCFHYNLKSAKLLFLYYNETGICNAVLIVNSLG